MDKTKEQKKRTLCADCIYDPAECGENVLDCQKRAKLYFKLYDHKGRGVNYA